MLIANMNLPIQEIKSHQKLWLHCKQPLFKVMWDQVDHSWANPFSRSKFKIFQYFLQLGRHIVQFMGCFTNKIEYRSQHGLTPKFLSKFGESYREGNNHNFFFCSGCLCIEPCLLVHGCTRMGVILYFQFVLLKGRITKALSRGHLSISLSVETSSRNLCQLLSTINIHTGNGGLDTTCVFYYDVESLDHAFNACYIIV